MLASKGKMMSALQKRRRERKAKLQDEQDKKNWVGKYDPKLNPVGTCAVCLQKKIIRKIRERTVDPPISGCGPGFRSYTYKYQDGFYCMGCGVRYEFVKETSDE